MRFTTYYSLFLPIHTLLPSNGKVTVSHFDLIPGRLRELAVMLCGQEKHNISRVSQKQIYNHSITQAAGGIMNINIIITVELIAAKAHPRIITAFHLTWPGTLLKCSFILNYFFVRGKINGQR